jgi:DNA-binding NarL/FixJ family response regulator
MFQDIYGQVLGNLRWRTISYGLPTPVTRQAVAGRIRIASGKTVDEMANEAGLAVGTVRQQLKSVFSKTGASRQAELVGVLAGSALFS